MTAKTTEPSKLPRRRGRPPTVHIAKRTTVNLDEEDVTRVEAFRAHLEKSLPKAGFTDPTIIKLLLLRALDAFEQEQRPKPELPPESSTKKK